MKKIIFVLALMIFIVSCRAHMIYPPMTKDGVTDQERKKDAFECKTMAVDFRSKIAAGGGGPVGVYSNGVGVITPAGSKKNQNLATEEANKYYIECMEVRGYRIVEYNK